MSDTAWLALQWFASILGLANIVLIIRRSAWNYPVALVMVAVFGAIVWQEKLYSDAGLQVFFFAMNVAGWVAWRNAAADDGEIRVAMMGWIERALWVGATVAATFGWGWLMGHTTDAVAPYPDAAVAMTSVAGQLLMIRRKVENWLWWIAVNLISILLYYSRALFPFAILYVVFLVMSVVGFVEWRRRAANGERIIV